MHSNKGRNTIKISNNDSHDTQLVNQLLVFCLNSQQIKCF